MQRRINITLPEDTVQLIDRVASRGNRSRFIDEAVKSYVEAVGRQNLRRRLKQGVIQRAERDLRLAEEWFGVDEEAWRNQRQ